MSNVIGYLAEEISKQCVEGIAWLFLTAYSKVKEERNDFKMEFLHKMEAKLKDLENSQLSHITKNKKASL